MARISAKKFATDERFASVRGAINAAIVGPQFIIDQDEFRIRVWHESESSKDHANYRVMFRSCRVVEDLRYCLEFIKQAGIDRLIKEDMLVLDHVSGFYWVTKKCEEHYGLPKLPHGIKRPEIVNTPAPKKAKAKKIAK